MASAETREHVLKIANQRYATKKFDPNKHISDEDWQTILQVGRLSPSSFGYEPWRFVLLKDEKLKDAIRPFSWGQLTVLMGRTRSY